MTYRIRKETREYTVLELDSVLTYVNEHMVEARLIDDDGDYYLYTYHHDSWKDWDDRTIKSLVHSGTIILSETEYKYLKHQCSQSNEIAKGWLLGFAKDEHARIFK
jgi:hypothetical protein